MYAKVEMINIQRQKAALAIAMHDNDSAIAILNQAATDIAKQDPKLKEEIDIDLCFLLRDAGQADEARKKWQQLTLKNVKNVRMQLFALCADVDANKLAEAEKKYKALLNDVTGTPMEVTAHEQYLRICEKRDDADAVQNVANQILALDPTNALALKVIQK
jgi:predicted Zn-dependent protease